MHVETEYSLGFSDPSYTFFSFIHSFNSIFMECLLNARHTARWAAHALNIWGGPGYVAKLVRALLPYTEKL